MKSGFLRLAAVLLGCALPIRATGQTAQDSVAVLVQSAVEAYRQGTRAGIERSIQLWIQVAALHGRMGDVGRQARALNNIGVLDDDIGRPDSALRYYRQALVIARAVGDRASEGALLSNIGALHEELGRPDSAIFDDRQALDIRRAVGDRKGEGETLQNIGGVYTHLGQPDSALFYFGQALGIERVVGDQGDQGTTLSNIASLHETIGRPDSALAYFRQALAIQRAVGDRAGEGRTLSNIAALLGRVARPDSALAYGQQALAIRRLVGDRRGEGLTLNNIGLAQANLGRPDSAFGYYQQAIAIERSVGDKIGQSMTLNNIGQLYHRAHADSALAYYRQALAIAQSAGDRRDEAMAANNIGMEQATLGRSDSALMYYRQALAIERRVGDRRGEGATLAGMSWVLHRVISPPDLARAAAYADSAASVRASLGRHAGGEANRMSVAEQDFPLFESWTLAWLARSSEVGAGQSALAALAASERGRSQALLDLMVRSSADVKPGRDLVAEGTSLLEAGRSNSSAVLAFVITADTVIRWVAAPRQELQVTRETVKSDTVAQLVAALRGALGVADAPRGRVALRGGSSLDADTLAVRGFGASRSAGGASVRVVSNRLAELLLPADIRNLPAGTELVIIPHGVIGLVPFAALPVDSTGTPLGSRFALRYAPSLAVLGQVEAKTPAGARNALVVGNPSMPTNSVWGEAFAFAALPGATAEAESVAAPLGATVLTGSAASETEVRRRLPGAGIVHLATHGYAYATEARARQSFVALAPDEQDDGFLTVGEILDDPALTLSADLVVLSACQSGLGDLRQAEGTVGLQRALLAKGARSVLVSLWNVSDAATALLMQSFYRHWLDDADHPSKAEALRRAQARVRADPRFTEPRYWAAFQLVGAR
jgi:tetratricopeptide (TPR) repeat protein